MNKPVAVLISDVHYSLPTLQLAEAAMVQAIAKSNYLQVPLIVAGDLHDTKANMRAECINAMIETFKLCQMQCYVLVGNHDRINEKAPEHSLNFLSPYVRIVDRPLNANFTLLPYYHDTDALRKELKLTRRDRPVIMHQGIQGSNSGEYIQDKSAINPEDVAGMRVISGHYHTRQDIKLPEGGLWSYIGNPYTLNYAEANDPPKGFQVLMDDGSLEFVPTNLREHRVMEGTVKEMRETEWLFLGEPHDLVWVKLHGTKEELTTVIKKDVAYNLDITQPFRLDLIPTDAGTTERSSLQKLSGGELVDKLIDQRQDVAKEQTERLKVKWRSLCE